MWVVRNEEAHLGSPKRILERHEDDCLILGRSLELEESTAIIVIKELVIEEPDLLTSLGKFMQGRVRMVYTVEL